MFSIIVLTLSILHMIYCYTSNRSFIKNALELDKINTFKGYLCYVVLEIVRIYKWIKFKHD